MKKKYVRFLLSIAGVAMFVCGNDYQHIKAAAVFETGTESDFSDSAGTESDIVKDTDSFSDFSDSSELEIHDSEQEEESVELEMQAEDEKDLFDMNMPATEIKYWKHDGDVWYCVGLDGQFLTGWQKIKNSIYYFNESGQMLTNWQEINGRIYLLDDSGRLQSGWKEIDGKWFYLNDQYGKLMGHVSLNGYMYYFDPENGMQTGWQKIDDQWFYFRASGRQQDGWYTEGEKWYYLDPEKGRAVGQFNIDGDNYFFDENGIMQTGWQTANGKLFYYQEKGQMLSDVYMRYEGKLYYLSEQGAVEDNSITGNYSAVFDVTSKTFGANGNDTDPDTKAIQKALDQAVKFPGTDGSQILVRIPAGTYYTDGILNISSNTALELDPDAKIVRTDLSKVMLMGAHRDNSGQYCWGSACSHGGYSQLKNVSISGGIWDGNAENQTDVSTSSIITLAHGTGISVKNTTIKNGTGYHMLVLDGIENAEIEDVIFKEQLAYTGKSDYAYFNGKNEEVFERIDQFTEEDWQQIWKFKEALHMDFTNEAGSSSYPFDDTACKNIRISGCDFEDVLAGIGSHHSVGTKKHTDINIEDNVLKNLKGNAVGAMAMKNLYVKNNDINDVYMGLYATENSTDISFSSNMIQNTKSNGIMLENSAGTVENNTVIVSDKKNNGIRIKANSDTIQVSGNTIKGGFNGISAGESTKLTIYKNTISECRNSGISITDSEDVTVKENMITDSESGIDIGFWNCISGSCTENVISNCMADNIKSDKDTVTIENNSAREPLNGWKFIKGYWYYYKDGIMQTGWQKVNGKWYYMRESGRMHVGWLQDGKSWFYLTESGKMQYGWCKINNVWYYFNPVGGRMQTGWQKVNGCWYYLTKSGKMHIGWLQDGKNWFYLTESGKMQTGWYHKNGFWYYFNPSGIMQTGWQDINKNRYYLRESGKMHTKWLQLGDDWYYFNESGKMLTGWQTIENYKYYFDTDGKMATGKRTINGKEYNFGNSGKLQTKA